MPITATLRRCRSPVSCPSLDIYCSLPFRSLAVRSLVRQKGCHFFSIKRFIYSTTSVFCNCSGLFTVSHLFLTHHLALSPLFLGREHFPAEWPEEVLVVFQNLLSTGVLATVQSFDGSANVLSLTLHAEAGGGDLTAIILDTLQAQTKSNPCPSTTQMVEQADGSGTSAASTNANAPTGPPPETATTAPQLGKNASVTHNGWSSQNFPVWFMNLVACLYYYHRLNKMSKLKLRNNIFCFLVEDQKMAEQTEPPCGIDTNTDGMYALKQEHDLRPPVCKTFIKQWSLSHYHFKLALHSLSFLFESQELWPPDAAVWAWRIRSEQVSHASESKFELLSSYFDRARR